MPEIVKPEIRPEDEADVDHFPDSLWFGFHLEDHIAKLLDDLPPDTRRPITKKPKAKGKGAGTP